VQAILEVKTLIGRSAMSDDRQLLRNRIAELEALIAARTTALAELEAALAAERALADDRAHRLETSGRWLEALAARIIALRSRGEP
jgi:uncharacterized coiled-coil protein SlyX